MAPSLRGSGAAVKVASGDLAVPVHASTAAGDIMVCDVVSGDNVPHAFPDGSPEFRAAGAKSAGLAVATTVSAPAGVATGDLEVLIASTIAGATISITTAGGSAWTSLGNQDVTGGERLYAWYRVRQGGDSDPQVTASSDHVCAARLAYKTGTFDTTTPIDNWTVSNETTSDTSFSWAPGFNTSVDNCKVLCVTTSGFDSNTAQVPVCTDASLSGLASRANYETSNGAGGGFGITEGYLGTAGGVGTFACTLVTASAKAYAAFAIRPNPSATAWTIIAQANNGTGIRMTSAWKRAGSSEGTFTVTHTGGNSAVARCHSYQGCLASGNPIGAVGALSSNSGAGATGTATATGITPNYTNSGVFFAAGLSSGGTSGTGANNFASWTGTDPTFTENGDDNSVSGAREAGLGSAFGTSSGAATGSRSVSLSGMDGTGGWVSLAILFELIDASPTTPGVSIACAIAGSGAVTAAGKEERKIATTVAGLGAVTAPVKDERKIAAAVVGLGAVTAAVRDERKIVVPITGLGAVAFAVTVTAGGGGGTVTIVAAIAAGGSVSTAVKEERKVAAAVAGLAAVTGAVRDERKIQAGVAGVAAVQPRLIPVHLIAAAVAGASAAAAAVKRDERVVAAIAGASSVVPKDVLSERVAVAIQAGAIVVPNVTVSTPGGSVVRYRTLVGAGE